MSDKTIVDLVRETLLNPRAAALEVKGFAANATVVWMGMVCVVCVSVVLSFVMDLIAPAPQEFRDLMGGPIFMTGVVLLVSVCSAWLMSEIGRQIGGTAQFIDVLLVMAWTQFIQVLFQASVFLGLILVPSLVLILQFLALAWSTWIFIQFLDQVHEFKNAFKAAGLAIMAFVLSVVILSVVATMFGAGV